MITARMIAEVAGGICWTAGLMAAVLVCPFAFMTFTVPAVAPGKKPGVPAPHIPTIQRGRALARRGTAFDPDLSTVG